MEQDKEIQKFEIYAQTTPVDDFELGYGFVYSDKSVSHVPEKDFILPIFLRKTYNYLEYVDVKKDTEIIPIQRQQVNPYFVEFSFFDDIDRVGVKNGYQLTNSMVSYIRERRSDVSLMTDQQIREWFDSTGYYELPWNRGSSLETTLIDIEKEGILVDTITGKAQIFKIDINS